MSEKNTQNTEENDPSTAAATQGGLSEEGKRTSMPPHSPSFHLQPVILLAPQTPHEQQHKSPLIPSTPQDDGGVDYESSSSSILSVINPIPSQSSSSHSATGATPTDEKSTLCSTTTDFNPDKTEERLGLGLRMIKIPNKATSRPEERLIRILFDHQGAALPMISWESRKKKTSSTLDLSQIREIRLGPNTKAFDLHRSAPSSPLVEGRSITQLKPSKLSYENRAFSIIYVVPSTGTYKMLNLIAPTPEDCSFWVHGLHALLTLAATQTNGEDLASINYSNSSWLRQKWLEVGDGKKDDLDLDQVTQLLKTLNVKLSKLEVKSMCKIAKIMKTDRVAFDAFERLYSGLRFRPEIASLFSSIASTDAPAFVTYEAFKKFVYTVQMVDWSEKRCIEVFEKYTSKITELRLMDIDHFSAFLSSSSNSIFKKRHAEIYMDMNHPLSNYYINSSHNTYLLGDQLTGESSLEGYVRALLLGCRSVEIDCFDGPNNEPLVYHAHTFTTRLLFRDVVETIASYAFLASSYPLILSLETHCSPSQQAVMASMLINAFGEKLVYVPINEDQDDGVLPSPKALLGKILIKGKLPLEGARIPPSRPVSPRVFLSKSNSNLEAASSALSLPSLSGPDDMIGVKREPKRSVTHPDLMALCVYCKAIPYAEQMSLSGFETRRMLSLSEKKADALFGRKSSVVLEFISRHLVRIYPSSFRVTSTNLNPIPYWSRGCQMAALNFQTYDRSMQLNNALFAGNGGTGYVLRPYLENDNGVHNRTLNIGILSAQQLPRISNSESSPFVEVGLIESERPTYFMPASGALQTGRKYRTKPSNQSSGSNNFMWKEELSFTQLPNPKSLVFLRFQIFNRRETKSSELIGTFCIRLCDLEQGYRHVPLFDRSGVLLRFTTLFVFIRLTEGTIPP